jgi:hypothetical protein
VRALDYYESGARVTKFLQDLERSRRKSDWTLQACAADNVDDDKAGRSDEWGDDEEDRANKLLNKPLEEGWKDYVHATDRMRILGGPEQQVAKFAEVFRSAPIWLLQFTWTFLDAKVLKFDLPDLSEASQWGKLGLLDAQRWPMLPVGVMTDGDPIPAQETDVSADLSIEELLFALDATNRPPWEWTRRERLVIESLSARNIDETLRAKIESYKRRDELYSKIHQVKKTTDT